jgi:cbb3-type cytochrome oxidase maturation protein
MGLEILYLLIPATLVLAGIALLLFVWAIQSGQFDDLETPAIRVLFDEVGPQSEGSPGDLRTGSPGAPHSKRAE